MRWSDGTFIRWNETKLLIDPLESDTVVSDVFISHAHYDHARAFDFPVQKKYSTRETKEIYESDNRKKIGNWQEVRVGRRLKLGEVEVEAHNAGHVLGSVQYEIITHEGTVVYASHLNFQDTLLRAADVVPCDLLVMEAPYASSLASSSERQSVIAEIVKWALECINKNRVPSFETDSMGNRAGTREGVQYVDEDASHSSSQNSANQWSLREQRSWASVPRRLD